MNKTVLVTGGAGYIGSTLVHLLLNNSYKVLVLDNLSFGGESLLNACLNPDFTLIKGCVTSTDLINDVFRNYKIDSVVHLAAIVGDPACAKQPDLARRVNLEGSLQLLEISIKHGVQKFVFASTCSNYGKMKNPMSFVDEASPLAPVSLYAELKVQIEKVILSDLKKNDNFCPTALRFATAYGVSSRMRFDLTVNEFTKELALGKELEVFGEQFWRPYCHVYDIARSVLLVLESTKEQVAFNVFNVGDTNENYQKRMIVEEIIKVIPDSIVKYVKKIEDPRDYRVSFEKVQNNLNFRTTRKVIDGIREVNQLIKDKIILTPDDSRYRNI